MSKKERWPRKVVFVVTVSAVDLTDTCLDIKDTTEYSPDIAHVDLADFSTIPTFIEKLDDNGKGVVDIAICNAGVTLWEWRATTDGWESKYEDVSYHNVGRLIFVFPAFRSITFLPL